MSDRLFTGKRSVVTPEHVPEGADHKGSDCCTSVTTVTAKDGTDV